jgi:hypothetical protein
MTILRRPKDSHFMDAVYVVLVGFCLLLLSSCAHDPALDKKIHDEAAAQPVLGASARADAAQQTIQSSGLSDSQKAKLSEITRSAQADLKAMRDQESQLRLLLVKELVDPASSEREIEGIKQRILELNSKSNKRWLAAIDDAHSVLGRRNSQDANFYRAFMQEPGGAGGRSGVE